MNGDAEPSAYAYICVRARAPNAGGDAVIASLPVVPDEVKHRGDPYGEDKRWKRTRAMFKTPNVTPDDLEAAISHLFDRLHPHLSAFHAIRDAADLWMAVVIDPIAARYQLRLTPHTVAWLQAIHAAVWFDVFFEAPSGTECGPVCGYCGLGRPAPDEERVVDVLNGWGPYRGIADARLVVGGLYEDAARPITDSWKFLYACLDDLGVFVLAGRPFATTPKRAGAVAVGVLLKRLRASRKVWRAIRSREDGFAEFRVQHWANAPHVDAWLTRRDLRRMAQLDAGFLYQVIPDPKPSFREDGRCNHCAYVQAWSAADARG
ncbi:MAG: hypothetical protein QOF71_907 [Candidatus Eremiobacteraeota bacterium]|jgi:hypothetical protein|nr:hypothetical protein [Candidatus Eremiobacteraeota bacterium]